MLLTEIKSIKDIIIFSISVCAHLIGEKNEFTKEAVKYPSLDFRMKSWIGIKI